MPMTASGQLEFLRDPRLSIHATSALPVWLWSGDATAILWANPPGAAIFGAATPAAFANGRFVPSHPAAQQIARLVGSLPPGGAARLERLRGFGAGFGRTQVCLCARIVLSDQRTAILVAATEAVGPRLSLAERVHRLMSGNEGPFAAFSADGSLLYAGAEAGSYLGGAETLAAAGADALVVADAEPDLWNPNAIRASTGAVFTLPVVEATLSEVEGLDVALVAAVVGAPTRYTDADLSRSTALVVGAEDKGLSQPWRDAAGLEVSIPVRSGTTDSLNAATAAAVLLYEAVRQRG